MARSRWVHQRRISAVPEHPSSYHSTPEIGFPDTRILFDFIGLSRSDDASLSQNCDTVSQGEDDVHVVLDDHLGRPARLDLFQEVDRLVSVMAGHACSGLVKKQ